MVSGPEAGATGRPHVYVTENGTVYDEDKKKYCSKVYAGYGRPTWNDRVMASLAAGITFPFTFDSHHRLPPIDHPLAVV